MEEEWIRWMRENAPPELYEEMKRSTAWSAKWRDDRIEKLESLVGELWDLVSGSKPRPGFAKEIQAARNGERI